VHLLQKTLWKPLKKLIIELPYDPAGSDNPTSGYISTIIQRRVLKTYLHTHVYSSIIHKSQETEATKMSIDS